MDKLLAAIADVVRSYGLEPQLGLHGPGVWINGGKVASVGVAVRKWVTFHGMALNVNTDVDWFRLITPCGNPTERITSIAAELGSEVDFADCLPALCAGLCPRVFLYASQRTGPCTVQAG